jgi:DNA-binding response OmpR family regulator
MNAPAFCPHCGADIRLDQPICLNDFSMFGDGYPLLYMLKPLPLSRAQASLVWTLMKACPHKVSVDTIMIRIGSDCESNVIDVLVSRIRAICRELNVPNHIETMRGRGYPLVPDGATIQEPRWWEAKKRRRHPGASPSLTAK